MKPDYTLSVSFQPTIIKYALDDFVAGFRTGKFTKAGPHIYNADIYRRLGL